MPELTATSAPSRGQLAPVLTALLLGTLMSSLSILVITTALPVIIASLGGMELYSWAFAAAMITSTPVVPIAGKLSDLYGRKALYLIGMGIFMLGSALAGAAQTIEQLIVFRALQGVGAGCVQPTVSALIADLFPPEQRGRWQGINGAIWGLSSVIGPILGGYLAEHVDWRWAFYINLAPGLLAGALMARFLPGSLPAWVGLGSAPTLGAPATFEAANGGGRDARAPAKRAAPGIDYAGMAWLSTALIALLLATLWGGKLVAWLSPQVLGLLALSVVASAAFIRQERQAPEPIVPLELFRNRTFQTVILLLFLTGAGLFGALAYVPLYLQAVLGISPTESGLLFAPSVLGMAMLSVLVGIFMHRIGYRRVTCATMATSACGFGLIAWAGQDAGVLPVVLGLSIIGGALGVSFPILIVIAQNVVSSAVTGAATSTVQLTRSLGGTLGVAVLGAYIAARLADLLGAGATGQREVATLLRPEALATLSAADVAFLRGELGDAIRGVFAVAAVMMALAALLALRIDNAPVSTARRVQ